MEMELFVIFVRFDWMKRKAILLRKYSLKIKRNSIREGNTTP